MEWANLSFEHPQWLWLLLSIPALVLLSWRALLSLDASARYAALLTRCVVILVLVACIAGIQHVRVNKNLTVLFLLDRSHSIPKEMYAHQERFIREVTSNIPERDRVGVLTFDGQSYVEQLPMEGDIFIDVVPETTMQDRTDLAGAVRMALALFPEDTSKRMVVVSDGNNNVGDVLSEIERAAAGSVGVDVVPLTYTRAREVFAEKLVAPATAKDKDMVTLRAIFNARRPIKGTVSLLHNGQLEPLPEEYARQSFVEGQNLVALKVKVEGSGAHRFEIVFRPDNENDDTLVENNRATAFTFVGGRDKVLLISRNIEDDLALVDALKEEKINTKVWSLADNVVSSDGGLTMATPGEGPLKDLDLLSLMQFSTVILSNVAANWFTNEQHENLVSYVRDMGGGLIMVGGDEAFGAGGWISSPVEDIMPVDFEIKHRQVIPRGALAVIMHSCEMPRGNFWGKEVAKKSVETISSRDYFGMLSYSHMRGVVWDVPLEVAQNKTAIKQIIDKMNNGDMPSFSPTMDMAVTALLDRKDAAQRHVIIISDGDAQPPLPATISLMKKNKITCSTVAIGFGAHVMAAPMRKLANDTGGRFYLCNNPKNLPQIFVKESKVIRRPLISEEPFRPQLSYAGSELWAGFPLDMQVPGLGGLVMTSPKNDAMVEIPLVRHTTDGDDPLLAHWRVGLGKTVAFTSGYWPYWGERWTTWSGYSKFWAQVVRWTMSSGARGNYDVNTRLEGTRGRITVNALDLDSNYQNFLNLSAQIAKPGGMGVEKVRLTQVGPGQYEGSFEVTHTGQYVANVIQNDNGQERSVVHSGLSVPYSPEYKELRANEALLQNIADISAGKSYFLDEYDADVFRHDLPVTKAMQPAWDWVLAWILLPLFLFDVAVRRLASLLWLSIFVEILFVFVGLFGIGVMELEGMSFVYACILVVALGELVGWSIRYQSIMPTIEFFTHNVVSLRGAGHSSANSLDKLKGTRDRTQEERTMQGLGQKLQPLVQDEQEQSADAEARFDVGDEAAKQQVGDVAESLGGAKAVDAGQRPLAPKRRQEIKHEGGSPMERLRKARERARQAFDEEQDQPKQE